MSVSDVGQCHMCGYCCSVRPCVYGAEVVIHYDDDGLATVPFKEVASLLALSGACKFLTEDNKCAKYDEIVEAEKDSKYPMFGHGCSSTLFNTVREAKIGRGVRE